ncbi:hypothetical protein JCM8547_004861 [Rhodosporidiobolus lusitaniae]
MAAHAQKRARASRQLKTSSELSRPRATPLQGYAPRPARQSSPQPRRVLVQAARTPRPLVNSNSHVASAVKGLFIRIYWAKEALLDEPAEEKKAPATLTRASLRRFFSKMVNLVSIQVLGSNRVAEAALDRASAGERFGKLEELSLHSTFDGFACPSYLSHLAGLEHWTRLKFFTYAVERTEDSVELELLPGDRLRAERTLSFPRLTLRRRLRADLPLERLAFGIGVKGVATAEMTKLTSGPTKHRSLEMLRLDNIANDGMEGRFPEWTTRFTPKGVEKLMNLSKKEGIELDGTALDAWNDDKGVPVADLIAAMDSYKASYISSAKRARDENALTIFADD